MMTIMVMESHALKVFITLDFSSYVFRMVVLDCAQKHISNDMLKFKNGLLHHKLLSFKA